MAAPIVKTILLFNGFKSHIVIVAWYPVLPIMLRKRRPFVCVALWEGQGTRLIVMVAPIAVTALASVQNLMKSSSRRFDDKSRSLDDRY